MANEKKKQRSTPINECTQQQQQQWQRFYFDRFVTGKWTSEIGSNSWCTFIGLCGTKVHTNTEPKFECSTLTFSSHISCCGDAIFPPKQREEEERAHNIAPYRLTIFHHLTGKWIENVLIAHLHATRIHAYSWINCVSGSTWAEKKEKTEFWWRRASAYTTCSMHNLENGCQTDETCTLSVSIFYISSTSLKTIYLCAQCVVLFNLTAYVWSSTAVHS